MKDNNKFQQVTAYTDETPVIASNSTIIIDNNEQKVKSAEDILFKKEEALHDCKRGSLYHSVQCIEAMKEYAQSENTALKLEVETGQGIVLKLLNECEDRKLEVERLKEALKKILSHADPYDQEGNVFISIAEQALKEK